MLPKTAADRFVDGLLGSISGAFENIGPDAEALAKDPTNLNKLAKFGTVAATIGTAAAIAAFPLDGPVAAALDGVAEAGDGAFDTSLGVKTAADGGQVLEGDDGATGDLVRDGVTFGIDGGGKILTHDADAAVEATEPRWEAVSNFEQALKNYPGPVTSESVHEALLDLNTDDRLTLENSGVDLTDARQRTIYIGLVKGAFKNARGEKRVLEAVNGSIQYGGGSVVDQTRRTLGGGEH